MELLVLLSAVLSHGHVLLHLLVEGEFLLVLVGEFGRLAVNVFVLDLDDVFLVIVDQGEQVALDTDVVVRHFVLG